MPDTDASACNPLDDAITAAATLAIDSIQSVTGTESRLPPLVMNPLAKPISIIEDDSKPNFRHELPSELHEYHKLKDGLSTTDGIIMYKDRIIIPPSLRDEVLQTLHSAHQGSSSMLARAEASIFWPGITPATIAKRAQCTHAITWCPPSHTPHQHPD